METLQLDWPLPQLKREERRHNRGLGGVVRYSEAPLASFRPFHNWLSAEKQYENIEAIQAPNPAAAEKKQSTVEPPAELRKRQASDKIRDEIVKKANKTIQKPQFFKTIFES